MKKSDQDLGSDPFISKSDGVFVAIKVGAYREETRERLRQVHENLRRMFDLNSPHADKQGPARWSEMINGQRREPLKATYGFKPEAYLAAEIETTVEDYEHSKKAIYECRGGWKDPKTVVKGGSEYAPLTQNARDVIASIEEGKTPTRNNFLAQIDNIYTSFMGKSLLLNRYPEIAQEVYKNNPPMLANVAEPRQATASSPAVPVLTNAVQQTASITAVPANVTDAVIPKTNNVQTVAVEQKKTTSAEKPSGFAKTIIDFRDTVLDDTVHDLPARLKVSTPREVPESVSRKGKVGGMSEAYWTARDKNERARLQAVMQHKGSDDAAKHKALVRMLDDIEEQRTEALTKGTVQLGKDNAPKDMVFRAPVAKTEQDRADLGGRMGLYSDMIQMRIDLLEGKNPALAEQRMKLTYPRQFADTVLAPQASGPDSASANDSDWASQTGRRSGLRAFFRPAAMPKFRNTLNDIFASVTGALGIRKVERAATAANDEDTSDALMAKTVPMTREQMRLSA